MEIIIPPRREKPMLHACIPKISLEHLRNQMLFNVNFLDAKAIRRLKQPLHICLMTELRSQGYDEASNFLADILHDNDEILGEDEIGIIVNLKSKPDYLVHIATQLHNAERERVKDNTDKECMTFLKLAVFYAELGKGLLWLAEKFYLASIAVAMKNLIDGGRLHQCCKYHYAKFILDKYPEASTEEPFQILMEVRHACTGKDWLMWESNLEEESPSEKLSFAVGALLHRILVDNARSVRKQDTLKSEMLARLAERRAAEANDPMKTCEAIIEVGICQLILKNANNAQKSFERAFKMYVAYNNAEGLCVTMMHMAAVQQRLGNIQAAMRLLTKMGITAIEHKLTRELGRAMHLLGEVHVNNQQPELGTPHFREAFLCFMGMEDLESKVSAVSTLFAEPELNILEKPKHDPNARLSTDTIASKATCKTNKTVYIEEAEQSRLMMAVSAGQDLMKSYFGLLDKAKTCTLANFHVTEWKLSRHGWWNTRAQNKLVPCMCKDHNWSAVEVARYKAELKKEALAAEEQRRIEEEQELKRKVEYVEAAREIFTAIAPIPVSPVESTKRPEGSEDPGHGVSMLNFH